MKLSRSKPYGSRGPSLRLLACALLGLLLFTGCTTVTFEKIDLRGHVRVIGAHEGEGFCFKLPTDWEIREKLEGVDVVCLSPPVKGTFRESVVAKALSAAELKDPQGLIEDQLAKLLTGKVEVVESWQGAQAPMLVNVSEDKFSPLPLSQLLFLHIKPEGDGVLICCTTTQEKMAERRAFFTDIVARAKFTLAECPGQGGVPDTFPTPEVTFSPAPAAAVIAPTPSTSATPSTNGTTPTTGPLATPPSLTPVTPTEAASPAAPATPAAKPSPAAPATPASVSSPTGPATSASAATPAPTTP